MQGRLSAPTHGRIQCFPESTWKEELVLARELGFPLMEWTLDRLTWEKNPLLSPEGRKDVLNRLNETGLEVPSLTGDCFMEDPFYRASGREKQKLLSELDEVLDAVAGLGIKMVVIPLVDQGSLKNLEEEEILLEELHRRISFFRGTGIQILFETDGAPSSVRRFISHLPTPYFGINYDIGNSAALGFLPREEFACYGERICNVHVKDRKKGGTTVPLKMGDADFDTVFALLHQREYKGNYILQTARSPEGNDAGVLVNYREMLYSWLEQKGESSGT